MGERASAAARLDDAGAQGPPDGPRRLHQLAQPFRLSVGAAMPTPENDPAATFDRGGLMIARRRGEAVTFGDARIAIARIPESASLRATSR